MTKRNNFELNFDESGAQLFATKMADTFTELTGINIIPLENQIDVIDSPMYGWSSSEDKDVLLKDKEARFVFKYINTNKNGDETIYFYPTDNKVMIWRSLSNTCSDEGAVNPFTNKCKWEDENINARYSIDDWSNYRG